MNKKILNYFMIILFISIAFIVVPNKVFAIEDAIYSIVMDMEVSKDGTAKVVEKWDVEISSGTELYKQYYNLETSKINNFSVSENGKKYNYLSNWDSSSSLEDKKDNCGINKTSAGVELCWGIGEYGRHEYTLEYEIENYIYEYDDAQVSNFILIPNLEDLTPKYVKITIKPFFKIKDDDVKIMLSGFSGSYSITPNGIIEIYVNGSLARGESMGVDLHFLENKFSLSSKTISLETTNNSAKSNTGARKVFITLCGVFALFIIANNLEKRRKMKKELEEQNNNDTK